MCNFAAGTNFRQVRLDRLQCFSVIVSFVLRSSVQLSFNSKFGLVSSQYHRHCVAFVYQYRTVGRVQILHIIRPWIQIRCLRCDPQLLWIALYCVSLVAVSIWPPFCVSLNRAEKTEVLSDDLLQVNMTFFLSVTHHTVYCMWHELLSDKLIA